MPAPDLSKGRSKRKCQYPKCGQALTPDQRRRNKKYCSETCRKMHHKLTAQVTDTREKTPKQEELCPTY